MDGFGIYFSQQYQQYQQDAPQWVQQSKQIRSRLGIHQETRLWTSRHDFVGTGLPRTHRVFEVLELAVLQTLGTPDRIAKGKKNQKWLKEQVIAADLVVDISQNPVRKAFTKNGKWPCLTTSSQLYSFARDSMLLPIEHLLLQGHRRSVHVPRSMSVKGQQHIKDLAGEGMSLPCLGLLIWCMVSIKGLP